VARLDLTSGDAVFSSTVDRPFSSLRRIDLDEDSWVEHAPGWISEPDRLFEEILGSRDWQQRSRRMYDRRVLEPRLTAPWSVEEGEPLRPPVGKRTEGPAA
jgi:hypothetical protein